ncbi:hypothetical protein ACOMHN_025017 [Nucella lapillus]
MTILVTQSAHNDVPAVHAASNITFHDGCIDYVFTKTGESSAHDHHSIASSEVEEISRRVKNAIMIILFLIGGPANVINMAVFYKQGLKDRVSLCLFALSLTDAVYLVMAMIHHGEQIHLQFTTKETFGPVDAFLANHNLLALMGCNYISYILSAIIATERCLCVVNPLKFQTLLRTRTMAVIIVMSYILVLGLHFIIVFRYRVGCVYDPVCGKVAKAGFTAEFYDDNSEFIDSLETFVFGAGLPGIVVTAVVVATKLTTMKLREIVTWRTETSSTSISPREVALTKMLVGNSILFLVCIFPVAVVRIVWLILPGMNMGGSNHNLFLTTLWINEVFTFVNASLNIFVYYAMGSRYRETLWALFGRKVQTEKE